MKHYALLLAALLAPPLQAAPLKVFANWAQPPKSYVGDDGALHGYAIDTARAVLKQAEIEHVFVPLAFPRAFELLKACEGLMVGVFHSAEREQYLLYSKAIVNDKVALVSRAGDPPFLQIPQDLHGKTLTYLSGAYFGIDLEAFVGVRLDQQASFEVMLRKLVAGRTDAVVISPREGVVLAAQKAGVPMAQLRIAEQPLAVVANHIVACRNDPGLAALLPRIDKAILQLRASGKLDKQADKPR
jgi:ABC-type amino acid transport substrate-binding protein